MDLGSLLFFCFSVVGLTQILVDSDMPLIEWLRSNISRLLFKIPPQGRWTKIFQCYQCCGTWCGFLCGGLIFGTNIFTILLSGFAGSYLAQLGTVINEYFQAQALGSLREPPAGLPGGGT